MTYCVILCNSVSSLLLSVKLIYREQMAHMSLGSMHTSLLHAIEQGAVGPVASQPLHVGGDRNQTKRSRCGRSSPARRRPRAFAMRIRCGFPRHTMRSRNKNSTVVSEVRWHRPQDVLKTCGVYRNHRHWGLCHWSSQSTITLEGHRIRVGSCGLFDPSRFATRNQGAGVRGVAVFLAVWTFKHEIP